MKLLRKAPVRELKNKTALLRVDLNIKSQNDYFRIDSIIPTIKYLVKHGARVVILSHRGRPAKKDGKLSLGPIANIISKKIDGKVKFIHDLNFAKIKEKIDSEKQAKVFMLENLRFFAGEEKNESALAKQLATLGDIYINDAFAVSHRKNASVHAITKYLKSYAGLLLEKEINGLTKATKNPKKPLIVILGGAKIGDKINIVKHLLPKTDLFLLGSSVLNETKKTNVRKIMHNKKCIFPLDAIIKNGEYLDIGQQTIKLYTAIISRANTIIWNGPVGMFENAKYAKGSIDIANAIAKSKAFKVVGGGETANFILKKKLDKKIDLLSTGGGAMLDFLAGKDMPGIIALK